MYAAIRSLHSLRVLHEATIKPYFMLVFVMSDDLYFCFSEMKKCTPCIEHRTFTSILVFFLHELGPRVRRTDRRTDGRVRLLMLPNRSTAS